MNKKRLKTKLMDVLLDEGASPELCMAISNAIDNKSEQTYEWNHDETKDIWEQVPKQIGTIDNAQAIMDKFAEDLRPKEHMSFSQRLEQMWRLLADDDTRLAYCFKGLFQQNTMTGGTCNCPVCTAKRELRAAGLNPDDYTQSELEGVRKNISMETYDLMSKVKDIDDLNRFLNEPFEDD